MNDFIDILRVLVLIANSVLLISALFSDGKRTLNPRDYVYIAVVVIFSIFSFALDSLKDRDDDKKLIDNFKNVLDRTELLLKKTEDKFQSDFSSLNHLSSQIESKLAPGISNNSIRFTGIIRQFGKGWCHISDNKL